MAEKCAALRNGDRWDFVLADTPKCPHCGEDFDINEGEAWEVYDLSHSSHELECPDCNMTFTVTVDAKFSFSTDNQDHDD